MDVAAWIALVSPAAAVLLIALAGERITGRAAGWVASLSALTAFVCSAIVFFVLLGENPEERTHNTSTLFTWLSSGAERTTTDGIRIGLTITLDPLSVFMMLVV